MSVKFKEARKLAMLSQKDVALKLSTTEATISRYESGKIKPDPDTLIALARIFNCTTDYLLGINSTPTQQQLNAPAMSPQHVHSAQDEELIRKFNMLDDRDKEDVMDDIDRKIERMERRYAEEGKRA